MVDLPFGRFSAQDHTVNNVELKIVKRRCYWGIRIGLHIFESFTLLETLLHRLVRGLYNGNWCGCRELHPDILRGGETFCC